VAAERDRARSPLQGAGVARRGAGDRPADAGDAAARAAGAAGRLAKQQRQHRIARLVRRHAPSSQAELVELLRAEGVVATQATVSRDLEELGAVKVRLPGGDTVYAIPELPKDQVAPEEHLRRVLSEWVVEVAHSANLVVVRTPPGCAHVVGSALDRAGLEDVLGTVAGDDTVLVVAEERAGGAAVAQTLSRLASLTEER
jgi:transcriptional regulator of arginine metabolism